MSSKGSTLVGLVVAILIVGAVASIGYYQFVVAPNMTTSATSQTSQATCTPTTCLTIEIVPGASSPAPTGTTLYGYKPTSLTLVIGKNNTVIWANNDTAPHTATAASSAPLAFDSGNIAVGATFQYTFTVPGTYQYSCSYHSWMHGIIVVKSA